MELCELLIKAYELFYDAILEFKLNDNDISVSKLSELRELLSEQPILEAGYAYKSTKPLNGENHEN